MNESRAVAGPDVFHCLFHDLVRCKEVAPVDFLNKESGEATYESRNRSAGGVHFDGDRDGVTVVLDQVDDRQLKVAGGVERFPELAFTRCAVTGRDVDDLVALVSLGHAQLPCAPDRFGAANGLEELRSRWR